MKDILQATIAQLNNIATLQYVDENWGQLDYYSQQPPVKYPCCLVDVGTIAWVNQGNKQQEGKKYYCTLLRKKVKTYW